MHGVFVESDILHSFVSREARNHQHEIFEGRKQNVFNGRLIFFLFFLVFVKGFSPALVAWFNHPFTSFWFYNSDQVFVLIEFEGSFIGVDADSMNHIVIGVILKQNLVAI